MYWQVRILHMDQGKVFISSILDPKKENLLAERSAVKDVVDSFHFLTPWAFEVRSPRFDSQFSWQSQWPPGPAFPRL